MKNHSRSKSSRSRSRSREREHHRHRERRDKDRNTKHSSRHSNKSEKSGHKLLISNVPLDLSESQVKKEFNKYCKVLEISLKPVNDKQEGHLIISRRSELESAMKGIGKHFEWTLRLPDSKKNISESNSTSKENKVETQKKTETDEPIITPVRVREIWVGNLPDKTSKELLSKTFFVFGEISDIELHSDKNYAFIKYRLVSSASKAYEKAKNIQINGSPIKISFSDSGKRHDVIGDEENYELSESTCKLITITFSKNFDIPDEEAIKNAFKAFGKIKNICKNSFNLNAKPSYYIEYSECEEANCALQGVNLELKKELGDLNCDVDYYFRKKAIPEIESTNNAQLNNNPLLNKMNYFQYKNIMPGANLNTNFFYYQQQYNTNLQNMQLQILKNAHRLQKQRMGISQEEELKDANTNIEEANNNNVNYNLSNLNTNINAINANLNESRETQNLAPLAQTDNARDNTQVKDEPINIEQNNTAQQQLPNPVMPTQMNPQINPAMNMQIPSNINPGLPQISNVNPMLAGQMQNPMMNPQLLAMRNQQMLMNGYYNPYVRNLYPMQYMNPMVMQNYANMQYKPAVPEKPKDSSVNDLSNLIKSCMEQQPKSTTSKSNSDSDVSSLNGSQSEEEIDFAKKYSLEEENLENVWIGFLQKLNKGRIKVDIYLIRGNLPDGIFKQYYLNIQNKATYEDIMKRNIISIMALSPSDVAQVEGFEEYIKYFSEKERAGVIYIDKYVLYIVSPGPFSRKFYLNPKHHLLAILEDNSSKQKQYVDMDNLGLPPPVISNSEKKKLLSKNKKPEKKEEVKPDAVS